MNRNEKDKQIFNDFNAKIPNSPSKVKLFIFKHDQWVLYGTYPMNKAREIALSVGYKYRLETS